MVVSRLIEANKARRSLEREAHQLRALEREQNIIRNLPENSNQESAICEVKHRLQQKLRYQQIKGSVRDQWSNGLLHIITPNPYQQYPYQPKEVKECKAKNNQDWYTGIGNIFDRHLAPPSPSASQSLPIA